MYDEQFYNIKLLQPIILLTSSYLHIRYLFSVTRKIKVK